MRRIVRIALAATAVAAFFAEPASAGVFADDLSKCLVAKTSPDDQATFVEWIFAAMALHPAVQPMSNIPQAKRDELDSKASQLMMRLMTVDCRPQLVAALKYEGAGTIEIAFGVLGQVAMKGLMAHPAVNKGMEALGKGIDRAKLQEVFKEAGLPTQAPPAAPEK